MKKIYALAILCLSAACAHMSDTTAADGKPALSTTCRTPEACMATAEESCNGGRYQVVGDTDFADQAKTGGHADRVTPRSHLTYRCDTGVTAH